jgi:16S rRNA G966 N2-methylase RsmD
LKNRSLVLLSGEATTLPAAEARSLFLAYDKDSTFKSPSERVLVVESRSDPFVIGSRIAFARRVGYLVDDAAEAARMTLGQSVRFRSYDLGGGPSPDPEDFLPGADAKVDLGNPDYEVALVRADRDYLAVTKPGTMAQDWSRRRPRQRAFFHPAAIFPKLSRALVNLTGCLRGDVFLDPFAGTGSLLIEAHLVGAKGVYVDQTEKMVRGGMANMKHFGQEWLGLVRADATSLPLTSVGAVATDIPYGRASSTRGRTTEKILAGFLPTAARIMRPGGRLVLMHQKEVAVDGGSDFSLEEEHDLHVHKLLTRTISVLRRT